MEGQQEEAEGLLLQRFMPLALPVRRLFQHPGQSGTKRAKASSVPESSAVLLALRPLWWREKLEKEMSGGGMAASIAVRLARVMT